MEDQLQHNNISKVWRKPQSHLRQQGTETSDCVGHKVSDLNLFFNRFDGLFCHSPHPVLPAAADTIVYTCPPLDPLQFAYQPGIGVDDAILYLLHRSLSHLEEAGSTVRIMFYDFSSAF